MPEDVFLSTTALDLGLDLSHNWGKSCNSLAEVPVEVVGDPLQQRHTHSLGDLLVPTTTLALQIIVHLLKKLAMCVSVICKQCAKAGVAIVEQAAVLQSVLVSTCNLLSSRTSRNSLHVQPHQQRGGIAEGKRPTRWRKKIVMGLRQSKIDNL